MSCILQVGWLVVLLCVGTMQRKGRDGEDIDDDDG